MLFAMDLSLKSCTSAASMDMDMDMDTDMDMNATTLKPCITTTTLQKYSDWEPLVDRLTNLPHELLIHILSLLPTKDAAATCVFSKRLWRVFRCIPNLDFDVSPISHCAKHPYKIQHFPSFVTFVDTVLAAHQSEYLTSFRLRLSVDFRSRFFKGCDGGICPNNCFPALTNNQIHAWISFPITRFGLKELDLCIHVKVPGHNPDLTVFSPNVHQLPASIFMCETLETLKLDVNLALDQIYTMSSFRLPNLKLLHLRVSVIFDDDFVTRLLSGCPLLEDLLMEAFWHRVHSIRISLPCLRRLCFVVYRASEDAYQDTDLVHIDTPNLEDIEYFDETASSQYSVTNLNRVVKANIEIGNSLKVFRFVRLLSNVKHLRLNSCLDQTLDSVEVMDQLPVFCNLQYLQLGYQGFVYWNIVLLAFLNRSPVLETLAFLEGFGFDDYNEHFEEAIESEQEFFRIARIDPPECCKSHLKRIVVNRYHGNQRELNLIQFLLRHALVLEELVVEVSLNPSASKDHKSMESTLRNLQRASITCSIHFQVPCEED